jgi:hypothetical protein
MKNKWLFDSDSCCVTHTHNTEDDRDIQNDEERIYFNACNTIKNIAASIHPFVASMSSQLFTEKYHHYFALYNYETVQHSLQWSINNPSTHTFDLFVTQSFASIFELYKEGHSLLAFAIASSYLERALGDLYETMTSTDGISNNTLMNYSNNTNYRHNIDI